MSYLQSFHTLGADNTKRLHSYSPDFLKKFDPFSFSVKDYAFKFEVNCLGIRQHVCRNSGLALFKGLLAKGIWWESHSSLKEQLFLCPLNLMRK